MIYTQWLSIYRYLLILLTGASFMIAACHVLMLWQKERTLRAVWFMFVYISLFVLFLSRSLNLDLAWITLCYLLLTLVLIVCNIYEWKDLVAFLQKKNDAFVADKVEAEPDRKTLGALAEDGANAVLGTTAQIVTIKPDSEGE